MPDKPEEIAPPADGSWPEVRRWRKEMRAALIASRTGAGRERREAWSREIERQLAPILASMECIGFFWPFKGEFDPRPLVRRLIADGTRAALPVVVEPKQPLEYRLWRPGDKLVPGVWKIPVPEARHVVVPDVVLAPVVGFDARNYRLGYGGGYFDRTLVHLKPTLRAIGVGFELGRLETIYPQAHDIPFETVVTERQADAEATTDVSSPTCYAGEVDPDYMGLPPGKR